MWAKRDHRHLLDKSASEYAHGVLSPAHPVKHVIWSQRLAFTEAMITPAFKRYLATLPLDRSEEGRRTFTPTIGRKNDRYYVRIKLHKAGRSTQDGAPIDWLYLGNHFFLTEDDARAAIPYIRMTYDILKSRSPSPTPTSTGTASVPIAVEEDAVAAAKSVLGAARMPRQSQKAQFRQRLRASTGNDEVDHMSRIASRRTQRR